MNYFSFLYQCNMIRVFPLCAGVIDLKQKMVWISTSVSPAWGLSAVGERAGSGGLVFPLRAGVIGSCLASRLFPPCVFPACGVIVAGVLWQSVPVSVSPACGLSGMDVLRNYSVIVFPLCGGYRP